ncbi:hypothetical protein I6M78_01595 [Acinetobacter bereziniae]|nr:hypothetical protein [Acinetobacter bereziniae]
MARLCHIQHQQISNYFLPVLISIPKF